MKQPHTEQAIEHTDDEQNTGNHKKPGAKDAQEQTSSAALARAPKTSRKRRATSPSLTSPGGGPVLRDG